MEPLTKSTTNNNIFYSVFFVLFFFFLFFFCSVQKQYLEYYICFGGKVGKVRKISEILLSKFGLTCAWNAWKWHCIEYS